MSIQDRVIKYIADEMNLDQSEVTPASRLEYDLGMDSLDIIEVVMVTEEEFDIEVPDEDAEGFATVQDLIDYIQKKTEQQ